MFRIIRLLAVLVLSAAFARPAAAEGNGCSPCADSLRSQVGYSVVLSSAALELLARAVAGEGARARAAFRSRFYVDTTRVVPRASRTVYSADTVAMWRAALGQLGAREHPAGDSVGVLGIATLTSLDRALARPDQPKTSARGLLVRDAAGAHMIGCTPPLVVTGPGADSLASAAGAEVWLQGYCRGSGRMEWIGGHAIGRPRVDLYVMGFCPYARRLEAQMSADLAKFDPGKAPEIAVHYLLYWDDEGPMRRVGSSHGERERVEDAVQILIRDEHPAAYWHYLKMRSQAEVPWEMLAQRAGLNWQEIGAIERRVANDLDALLTTEHEWNQRNYPRVGASPTVYWQGSPVKSIAEVPGFSAPPREDEKCSEGADSKSPAK